LKPVTGYHGYAVRLGHLINNLQLIDEYQPDYLIPSRGPMITNPDVSIKKLIDNIRSVYQNYLSINAYRWYYPERMKLLSDHVLGPDAEVDWMPYAAVINGSLPSWLIHIGPSKLILSEDNSAFLVDCGKIHAFNNLLRLKETGRFKNLDGIFITHYHSDHTNFVNDVVKEFNCPVYITEEIKQIHENPVAFQMPANMNGPIHNLTIVRDGEKLKWKEFTLSFYYFPGQTLYHDAVLFTRNHGASVFFIGDSFTPAGIDDYCLLNRNFLHPGTGYLYCLDMLKTLPGQIFLTNQHVEPLFSFSRQQLDHMTDVLNDRKAILEELLPWDNINYGIDEQWARLYPYAQEASPGQTIDISMIIFNHSDIPKKFMVEMNIPDQFELEQRNDSVYITSVDEGETTFKLIVPEKVKPGIYLITADVKFDEWDLREWSEAVIEVL
jgi:glyoxylase-like metal-dependent hydrolase (beta-lactamase superfamily II)